MRKLWIWITFVVVAGVLLALDLWLKSWSGANLMNQPPRVLVSGFLRLTYFENSGAAFGFLAGAGWGRWFLTIFNIVVLLGLLWYYNKLPLERKFWLMRVPLILIFAGGIGNLFDRIYLGVVRDMLEFLFINFAIFNLADVWVVVGVFSLLFVVLFVIRDFPFP